MYVLCLYCKHKGIEESVLRVFTHERQVLFLSAKLGRQSLRFRAAKTFFFGIPVFLYQDGNPVHHMIHWRQFCPSLISEGKEGRSPVKLRKPKFFFFRACYGMVPVHWDRAQGQGSFLRFRTSL
jgi:hypothetical protein